VFLKLQENVTLKDDFDYGDTGLALFSDKKPVSGSAVRAGDVAKAFPACSPSPSRPPAKTPRSRSTSTTPHAHLHDGVGKALENKDEEKALIDALKARSTTPSR
jgi:hypothetical protein